MHDIERGLGEQAVPQGDDALIQVLRTEAPAKDEQHLRILRDPEGGTAALPRGIRHAATDGVARHDDLGRGTRLALEGGARRGEGEAELGRLLGAHLVGEARDGVLLMQDVGHPVGSAPAQERHLDVGAEAYGYVGSTLGSKDLPHLALGAPHAHKGRDRRPGTGAVETRHHDLMEGIARLGDELGLQTGRLAKETHLVAALRELPREGKSRVDVSRRTAGGDGDLELICHFFHPFCRKTSACPSGGRPRPGQDLSCGARWHRS